MHAAAHVVAAGDGEVTATAGGTGTASLMRFTEDTITIHRGDTIEWDNNDPATPHTITFGTEPLDPMPPSGNVTTDADGARHATLNTPADSAHSGFILAAPQDRIGLATGSAVAYQVPCDLQRCRHISVHLRAARRSRDEGKSHCEVARSKVSLSASAPSRL